MAKNMVYLKAGGKMVNWITKVFFNLIKEIVYGRHISGNGQLRQETDFLLQRKLSEQCFEENGDLVDCEEDIQGIWWWKDEKCFDQDGNGK